jgi:translation initiation factor 4A
MTSINNAETLLNKNDKYWDNNDIDIKNMDTNTNSEKESKKECEFEEITNWDDLNISPDLLRGIYSYGFEKPSPIQKRAITPIIEQRDIIGQAQSGTGKTAAFSIGLLSHVNVKDAFTQALVLSPTRELTTQSCKVIRSIGSMMEGLVVQTLVGGTYVEEDISIFKKNPPHVIVGCPGRVFDMMRRNVIACKKIKIVVIDEADELLSSGFKEQLYNIFQYFNNDIQVALFSATLPENIYEITDKFMRNPVKIIVKAEQLTLEGISQFFVAINDDQQKYSTLKDLYSFISVSQCIIYCNSVKRVVDLYEAMKEDNFPVCCIHSNMDKEQRDLSFEDFRVGKSRVLISSNVTARGIDIQQVSVVINFDVPKDVHTYLHRIGRSGRWGRKGVGINFITRRDVFKIKEFEEYYSCQIKEFPENFDNIMR